jgi:ABC-type polysaccharide/polyol phosphate transport system ATPase subunit
MTSTLATNSAVGGATRSMVDAIGITKRFRFPAGGRPTTIKDAVLQRVRYDGHFGIVEALHDVSFSLKRGQSMGVIGENGSGKTTLLRVLAGIVRQDSGEIHIAGSVAPLLATGAGLNPYLSGRENALAGMLMLGLSRESARAQINDVIEFSELGEFIDAPVRTYSSGMTLRLTFAIAIRVVPDVLLIDEVFAVGDDHFSAKCMAWLADFKAKGKTVVLASHDASTIAEQCDVALWLDKGRVAAFGERMDVIRAYSRATSGTPVADAMSVRADTLESATAIADVYRSRLAGLLPLLRLPLIGYVRQTGKIKGGYEDGWTDGMLEFTIEPLRDVRSWIVQATVPAGMPEKSEVAVEVNGNVVCRTPASAGKITLRCNKTIPRGQATKVRIVSTATVNHQEMGISGDVRDVGARVDEIVFDH